jgi:hypothetical protein
MHPRLELTLRLQNFIASEAINGAYTELFAGLDPSITEANNGGWGKLESRSIKLTWLTLLLVSPFGKVEAIRKDFKGEEIGKKYWDWSMEQVAKYM